MSTQNKYKFEHPAQFREKYRGSVIIECPSCQTKFSVNKDLLNEQEMPRFHCSRCDHVFDMDSNAEQPVSASESLPSAPYQPDFNSLDSIDTAKRNLTEVKPESTNLFSQPKQSLTSVTSDSHRSLRIPDKIDEQVTPSPPHENDNTNEFEQLSMNLTTATSSHAAPKESSDFKSDDSIKLPYGVTIGRSHIDDQLQEEAEKAAKEIALALTGTASDAISKEDTLERPRPPLQNPIDFIASSEVSFNEISPVQSGPWRGFFVLLTPLLVTLALLSGWAFVLTSSPSISDSFAESFGSSLPKLPPAGLRVEGIKFNKIVLESGDIIHTIQGKVKNDSIETLSEVNVEGLAFDRNGKIITNSRVNAASSLADSRIKSLPLDMIISLQRSKPSKKFSIAPGGEQNFVIALVEDEKARLDLSNAAYFSARIHSVRN